VANFIVYCINYVLFQAKFFKNFFCKKGSEYVLLSLLHLNQSPFQFRIFGTANVMDIQNFNRHKCPGRYDVPDQAAAFMINQFSLKGQAFLKINFKNQE